MTIDISLFFYIGMILITSTVLVYITKILKQPSILAYVVAGVILGPMGLRIITGEGQILTLGELGVAFLLFGIGLEIDIGALKEVGLGAITAGIAQIILMMATGIIIALGFNFGWMIGIYIGLLLAFSSTMIVTKTLVDRDEMKSIHGRIMIGILMLQDIVAIVALSLMGDMGISLNVEGICALEG
jgi:Kef-type K+ transport system membrane component KefB